MGLGKTMTTISLASTDFEIDQSMRVGSGEDDGKFCCSATLVIVPPPFSIHGKNSCSTYPYTDPKRFETDILALWKSGEDEEANIEEAIRNDLDVSRGSMYINVLQQIESLRLICNLGLHCKTRHDKATRPDSINNWASVAQQAFDVQRRIGPIVCV
ncbi:hypothetical protein B0H63DRAFT_445339 [Podospora didyma]|uniref:SNF2 N-terminal domain-containing protein n=1 Tax=Podospora didyma TaxID=330526 RepID=A0AAE0U926_9PEZI|nr:hypothetical protein B0H63DRAFT_445339 [Podospora didyma]